MWKIILWHKYFWTKKRIFAEDNFLILELHFFSWTEQWRLASIFTHRVAQILCSANTEFLENTSEIKFRNAFCMKAVNEKCEKSFYDINIFERKKRIFTEDNFLILELQFCSWTEDPPVLLAIALHRFYAAQKPYFWKIQTKLNFTMYFE